MSAVWPLALAAPPPAEPRRSERLRRIAECVALLAEEVEALEHGDAPLAREVAERRERREAELREEAPRDGSPPPHRLLTAPIEEALRELEERAVQERRVRAELDLLRDESLPLARDIPRPATGGRYPVPGETGGQLNVRL